MMMTEARPNIFATSWRLKRCLGSERNAARAGETWSSSMRGREAAYAQEHIPRAINLPHRKMNRRVDADISIATRCTSRIATASVATRSTKERAELAEVDLIGGSIDGADDSRNPD